LILFIPMKNHALKRSRRQALLMILFNLIKATNYLNMKYITRLNISIILMKIILTVSLHSQLQSCDVSSIVSIKGMLIIYLICRFYRKCDENTAKILWKCANSWNVTISRSQYFNRYRWIVRKEEIHCETC